MARKKAIVRRRRPSRPTPKPKPIKRRANVPPVAPSAVTLARMKGTKGRGGGRGGEAWRIDADGKRAGVIFINVIDEAPMGVHASVQIYLNATSQGRHIGRVAYRKACEASEHDVIYAHMRKSNVASRRAAEEAGFVDVTPVGEAQCIMMRRRSAN